MPTLTEGRYQSDWLKYEAAANFSRDNETVVSGSGIVESGTVMGRVTATGKIKPHTAGASDGSQTPVGLLVDRVDATAADRVAVMIARDARVMDVGIIYGVDVLTSNAKATVNAALKTLGILVGQGA
jgi:hypothetical protein